MCEGETEESYFEAVRVHFNLTTAEVVVADNGSTDGSQAIAERLGARVVPAAAWRD